MERPVACRDIEPRSALLLALWREVGRHIDLEQSLPDLLGMLGCCAPLRGMRLDHVGRGRAETETLSSVGMAPGRPPGGSPGQLQRLFEWCRGGQARTAAAGQPLSEPLAGMPTSDMDFPRIYGPLCSEQGHRGVAVFALECPPDDEELAVLTASLEPLAAALENQLRLTELARLREAAEAERQSLLTRLGRNRISEAIVGEQGGLRAVMERVQLVAPADTSVLLLGETGSGKEVIARAIHERSARAEGPFIRVNCGAIPPELIDTELFGHVKGSFTGATGNRRGWFERADGGTLFLDEIGELPAAAQVRMLRVLQEGVFQRVGGEEEAQVDVRVVAATHRDLHEEVRAGRFREDLWYRVAIFPIELPPLRARREDIPALAVHFARRSATRLGLPRAQPTDHDVEMLRAYDWPGNIREFAAVIERAAILGKREHLAIAAALGGAVPGGTRTGVAAGEQRDGEADGQARLEPLEQAIAEHIRRALAQTAGRVEGPAGAARLLAVNPNTLRSRMRRLGIEPRAYRRRA